MQKFNALRVWVRSHKLVLAIYAESNAFNPRDRFGITQQLLRAIASVPTNLAEGSKCDSNAEYAHHVNIAEKSLAESQYLLILHRDVGNLERDLETRFQREAAGIARQLHALKVTIRRDNNC